MYILTEDKRLEIADLDNYRLLSIWSASEFAELFIVGEWQNCKVVQVNLDVFESEIIPLINKERYLLNIFPVNGKTGFVVELL